MPFDEQRIFVAPTGCSRATNPVTATETPSVFGGQRSDGAPRGQTWLPVSEPLGLNWVFDFPEEKPETGCVPAKSP